MMGKNLAKQPVDNIFEKKVLHFFLMRSNWKKDWIFIIVCLTTYHFFVSLLFVTLKSQTLKKQKYVEQKVWTFCKFILSTVFYSQCCILFLMLHSWVIYFYEVLYFWKSLKCFHLKRNLSRPNYFIVSTLL